MDDTMRGNRTGQWLGWACIGALALLVVVLGGPASGQDCGRHCPVEEEPEPGELEERVAALEQQTAALVAAVEALEAENDDLRERVGAVEGTVSPLTHDDAGDRLVVEGVNLEIVNGTGSTHTSPNGLGNLIVGYNEQRPTGPPAERTGSHNVVVGDRHAWTHWGGIVVGIHNSILNDWTSVTGGRDNIASGEDATVSGGYTNVASGRQSSVSGGHLNNAGGFQAAISGGLENQASGIRASVSGGQHNHANGAVSSVSGGEQNTAGAGHSSILGGFGHTVDTAYGHYPN